MRVWSQVNLSSSKICLQLAGKRCLRRQTPLEGKSHKPKFKRSLLSMSTPRHGLADGWMTAKVANKQGTVVVGEKRREEAKAKLGLPNIGEATPVAYCVRRQL